MENKYFYVSYEKELEDTKTLVSKIKDSGWISQDVIIVNCSPDYSSRLTQTVNHKLSHLNRNELYEVVDMQMPYPTMSQVWNQEDKKYQLFIPYLADWVNKNMLPTSQYLFIDSGTLRGFNFSKIKSMIRGRFENYRFASLYVQDDSVFTPDFYVEKFNKQKQGGLLFQWENVNNPNWDY